MRGGEVEADCSDSKKAYSNKARSNNARSNKARVHPGAVAEPTVVLDLDGTLTVDVPGVAYGQKPVAGAVVEAAARARAAGFRVVVHTARGMRSKNGDLARLEAEVRPEAEAWLNWAGVGREALMLGKPWCGPGGFYVDDRALRPEDFVVRFSGPLAGCCVRVFVAGVPEAEREEVRARVDRLERFVAVRDVAFVQQMSEVLTALGPGSEGELVLLIDAERGVVDLAAVLAPVVAWMREWKGVLVVPAMERIAGVPTVAGCALVDPAVLRETLAGFPGNLSLAAAVDVLSLTRA